MHIHGHHHHHHHSRRTLPGIPEGDVQAKYDYYAHLVTANGGKMQDGVDTVLALRGLGPDGKRHDSNENVGPYNDMMVLLHKDKEGKPSVQEFRAQTHAGQKASSLEPKGVAQIRPGTYQAVPNGPHDNMASWHVITLDGDGHIPCWRDANKDGYLSAKEKKNAQTEQMTATEILVHNGVFEDHGSSIGCQVLPPKVMPLFINSVGEQNSFFYTLVDANAPMRR